MTRIRVARGRLPGGRFHRHFHSAGAQTDPSSGRKDQARGMAEIPVCTHRIGTLAIVEPDKQWWRELNLGSPEAIIKVFVQQSGCFSLVNRGGRCAAGRWSARWPNKASSRGLEHGRGTGQGGRLFP